jgi:hypothetical protein
MHLIGYLYEDYHDARSLEHKIPCGVFNFNNMYVIPANIPDKCSGVVRGVAEK